jgi:GMP synthase (glutamine-hydrolysing)
MDIRILQHAASESPGIIPDFLDSMKMPFSIARLYETNELLPVTRATHLIVLGGPMSVHEEKEFPFLAQEKVLIRQFQEERKPVLGICLGAQLIASALGAPVTKSIPETGWYPIKTVHDSLPALPPDFYAFQLHEDTFGIPRGGTLLCTGERVQNQAFSFGCLTGLQFHIELTRELIMEWICGLPGEEQATITRESDWYLPESNRICAEIIRAFSGGFQEH